MGALKRLKNITITPYLRKVDMAIWRVLSIWHSETLPPPPTPSRFKNPGHAPEEEKEIAELSKEESTRTVTTISANHYICFNKKKK